MGKNTTVSGTSASVPVLTAIIAMLNDARIKARLPTLGFINPLLYAISEHKPQGFNDVTEGRVTGCSTDGFAVGGLLSPCTVLVPDFVFQ